MRITGTVRVLAVAGMMLGVSAGLPAVGAGAAGTGAGASPVWRVTQYFGACQSDGVMSVSATGARDAWATGQAFSFQCDSPGLLIAHWDGRSWHDLTPPPGFAGVRNDAIGTSVAALSPSLAWVFVNRAVSATHPPGSFALLWQGGRWRQFRLPDYVQVSSSAVFSPSDAWALGTIAGHKYAARFNGKRWKPVPIPVRPQDAALAGPRNIWAVGTLAGLDSPQSLALAHWTGRWHNVPLPTGIASRPDRISARVLSDGSGGAWVAITVLSNIGEHPPIGGKLLHWTGRKWLFVKVPFPTLGLGPLARDGRGGLWVASTSSPACPGCDISAMFRYNAGTWSMAPVNVPGLTVTAMRLIGGTTSVWASGANVPVPGGEGDTVGVMLKYGP
jgi:hypothetical protein